MKTLIYGGTFNPVHYGHIRLAINAKKIIEPDKMLLIPSFISPHKQTQEVTDSRHRFEMARIAAGLVGCDVSDIEIQRSDVSYSVNTLRQLVQDGYENIHFLMGSDMFLYLEKWYCFEEILKLCTPVAASRKAEEKELLSAHAEKLSRLYGGNSIVCDFDITDISSTELRRMIWAGEDVSEFIPPQIIDYIEKNGLYRS